MLETYCLNMTTSTKICLNGKPWAHNFSKEPFVLFAPPHFWSPGCENSSQKKNTE